MNFFFKGEKTAVSELIWNVPIVDHDTLTINDAKVNHNP